MQYCSPKAEWLYLTDKLRNFGCFACEVDYNPYKFRGRNLIKMSMDDAEVFFCFRGLSDIHSLKNESGDGRN